MNAINILGYMILALPFVIIFLYISKRSGVREAIEVFLVIGALIGVIALGAYLSLL